MGEIEAASLATHSWYKMRDVRLEVFAVAWLVQTIWQVTPWDVVYNSSEYDSHTEFALGVIHALPAMHRWTLALAAAAVLTRFTIFLYPALVLHGLWTLGRAPFLWDSDYWGVMVDTAITAGFFNAQFDNTAAAIRGQFSWFYMASGFWKLNRDFADIRGSCATVFFEQLAARFAFPMSEATEGTVARVAAVLAPGATLVIELAIGVLMFARFDRAGALLALLLHLAICFTPAPHNISPFALKCAVRLIVFADVDGTSRVWRNRWTMAALVIYAACVTPFVSTAWSPKDIATLLYNGVAAVVAACIAASTPKPRKRSFKALIAGLLAAAYSFGGLITGVMEQGTPNMFANLKVHGGSRHFLLPTGLLQHWGVGPYGGGVIRVKNTSSAWINSIYPADLTDMLQPPDAVRFMALAGFDPPKYFNPGHTRVLGPTDARSTSFQYTVPALELRRLVQEARNHDKSFTIVYDHLPGTIGDEIWRATATISTVTATFDEVGNPASCEVRYPEKTTGASPCNPHEVALQPMDDVHWLVRRFSLYHPYPIFFNTDLGIPPYVICFGP